MDRVGVCALVSASVGEGEEMLDGLLLSTAILETACCTFSADCHRGSVVRRASIRRVHIWEEAAADRTVPPVERPIFLHLPGC